MPKKLKFSFNLILDILIGTLKESHLDVLTFFPITGGCSEGLGAF